MGTDALNYKVGAVSYPLTSSTTNPLLQDADPALFYVLDYLASMVTTLVGARLVAQAAAVTAPISSAVVLQLPYDPEPYLQAMQDKFPLFAVFRKRGAYEMQTLTQWHRRGEMGVTYVLPPLTAGQAEALLPILHATSDAMASAVEVGAYPTYTPPGGSLGQSAMQIAGIAQASVVTDAYGMFPGADGLVFPAWTAVLSVHEQRAVVTGYDPFGAVDIHEDLGADDETKITDFVQDATDVQPPPAGFGGAPTITSVTPSTGTTAGGTSVTISGSNFFAGCAVSFGGVAATSVVVTNSHTITCATPAHAAGVTYVSVVNANGTFGSLDNSFTYA